MALPISVQYNREVDFECSYLVSVGWNVTQATVVGGGNGACTKCSKGFTEWISPLPARG